MSLLIVGVLIFTKKLISAPSSTLLKDPDGKLSIGSTLFTLKTNDTSLCPPC